jgi:cytochrome b561
MPVSRYHPLLVTLHWLLAILIIAMLAVRLVRLRTSRPADAMTGNPFLGGLASPWRVCWDGRT